jgi:fumarate reductase subunit D
MASNNRTLRVTKDEWTFFGTLLPYFAMIMGGVLVFLLGVITRLGIMAQYKFGHTDIGSSSKIITWIVIISMLVLSAIAWKLFSQRRGHFVPQHATVTVILAHLWVIMAIWQQEGSWMFGTPTAYAFFYGSIIVALSWCIRKWAVRDEEGFIQEGEGSNPFEEAGLGAARIDGKNSSRIAGGHKFRLKLPIGKSIEDAKNKKVAIAQIARKPRTLVHVASTGSGIEGEVDVTVLDDDPFRTKHNWMGPEYYGESIVLPITYATYDTDIRPELYIAGKNGGSCQHFLTMGMSGTGKSKAWQVIYGTVLNRKEVSVIFGDPAKGMQTGGPLASGLEWFATTEAECMEQIEAIERAIVARTNYLTSKGLDHWVRGCGINFLIFHLEEAARFAKVDELVELIEAARSAGISMVISLQRATNDRLKTSARYNLGGNMCFGVKMKRDAAFGLSEFAIESGAAPHMWQDKYPGYHYLEANGLDASMAGHPLVTDWIDTGYLEQVVDEGHSIRTPLDNVTADALGPHYAAYRMRVQEGTTNWQELRRNRGHDGNTWEMGRTPPQSVAIQEELPFNVEVDQPTETKTVATASWGFQTPVEETEAARQHLRDIIADFKDHGKNTFTPGEIKAAGFSGRSDSWISQNLRRLVTEGLITYDKKTRFYSIV